MKNELCLAFRMSAEDLKKKFTIDHNNPASNQISFDETDAWFAPRDLIEKDESFLQLIPYVVLRAHNTGKFFAYRRSSVGGDDRQYGNWSIGVGGHIGLKDMPIETMARDLDFKLSGDIILCAALREIEEEVGYRVQDTKDLIFRGLIHTTANAISRVHYGILLTLDLGGEYPLIFSDEMSETAWMSAEEMNSLDQSLVEEWSKIALKELTN